MPYTRTARGARTRVSQARLSATITDAYVAAHGAGQVALWRRRITQHTQAVWRRLEAQLGADPAAEWPRSAMSAALEEELRTKADEDVHEAYLELHPPKAPKVAAPWDRFEAQPQLDPDHIDPVWTVQHPKGSPGAAPAASPAGDELGTAARLRKKKPAKPVAETVMRPPTRRSDWLTFWQGLSRRAAHALDWHAFESQVVRLPSEQRHQTPEAWWAFWQQQLDQSVLDEPRLYALWAVAESQRARARVVGASWLDGSALGQDVHPPLLSPDVMGHDRYRALWLESIGHWLDHPEADPRLRALDWPALARTLEPDRDRLIDWRGWQTLTSSEGLWPLPAHPWVSQTGQPHALARELPQWAFMRLAASLALEEAEPMAWVGRFYEAFSTLSVLPSETLLREAGKRKAQYLEDQAARVPDQFETIHAAIHRAAIGTKWTGTVALDWRAVRAKGSSLNGRRVSQGVEGFLRPIDMNLAAQDRSGDDRPVTVLLPLWHREALDFLQLRRRQTPRLQPVLVVPDLFMDRLREQGSWSLFDPDVFPEVLDGSAAGYLAAEAAAAERRAEHPNAVQRLPATRVWRQLLSALRAGSPFLLFEDAQRPYAPFPQSAPSVAGLDGVGALPLPPLSGLRRFTAVAWPSAAVNLSKAISATGDLELERLRTIAALALRALDNAVTASKPLEQGPTAQYRPVCLGVVGYYEAIVQASAQMHNDPDLVAGWVSGLAEAWAAVVVQADQQLCEERGAAPAWQTQTDGQPFDPQASHARLREARHGAQSLPWAARQDWAALLSRSHQNGHRCSVRTVWAPFLGAAALAGVTPGGVGALPVVEPVLDDAGQLRQVPSPLLLLHARQRPEEMADWVLPLRHPQTPQKWPAVLAQWVEPDRVVWAQRLKHAALIRQWVDQGVAFTLPAGLDESLLHHLVQQAWWLGLTNVRVALPPGGEPQAAAAAGPEHSPEETP